MVARVSVPVFVALHVKVIVLEIALMAAKALVKLSAVVAVVAICVRVKPDFDIMQEA
ncbi:MAG: hypothetical protein IKJ97_07230 [Bacteroidaceae bacterium]|nr:hypothetical protein [Bacteroidaceae bacterium]